MDVHVAGIVTLYAKTCACLREDILDTSRFVETRSALGSGTNSPLRGPRLPPTGPSANLEVLKPRVASD
eukprot:10448261-Alexandrium_andersonii.AAC.1